MINIRIFCCSILFLFISLFGFSEGKIRWYRSQINTGQIGNCGPSVVSMVATWARDKPFSVEEVRKIIGTPFREGDTSFEHLEGALKKLHVDYYEILVYRAEQVEKILKDGSVVILLFYPRYIPEAKKDSVFGRGYSAFSGGHYSVIYDEYEDYFLVNDPWLNGEDRYYKKNKIMKSMVLRKILVVPRRVKWR